MGPATESRSPEQPDFSWPYHSADCLFDWLRRQSESLRDELSQRRFPCFAVLALLCAFAAYVLFVWVSVCYVHFPVDPYGVWDIAKWIALIGISTLVALTAVSVGSVTIAFLFVTPTLIAVYFNLSLGYVCWAVWKAKRTQTTWLRSFRPIILAGITASVVLATVVDGSDRFWDRPFELSQWAILVFIAISGWAALFCHLVRDKILEPAMPRTVSKWTVGIAVGISLLAHWRASSREAEYFLRKAVTQHPTDAQAWLDLAWHYANEGNKLAADSGDTDHSPPPDPTSFYRRSLESFNQAMDLGADGFALHLTRAELADALGEKQEAVSFGQQALALASTNEEPDQVKWLREMIARNAAGPATGDEVEQSHQELIRNQRRARLRRIVPLALLK